MGADTLLAFGPAEVVDGDLDVVVVGVSIPPTGGMLVAIELANGLTTTVRLPPEAMNRPEVLEAGRSAA